MDSVDRAKLLLITFGDSFEGDVDFDVLDMGFVPTDTLLDIYCASTAFLVLPSEMLDHQQLISQSVVERQ